MADGRGGLTGDAEEDGHAVKDAALDAAWVVGLCVQARPGDARLVGGGVEGGRGDKGFVVPATVYFGAEEAGADLEALDSGDREHSVADEGLELVKGRLAEAGGGVRYRAAGAVVLVAQLGDAGLHALRGFGVRNSSTVSARLRNVGSALMASVSPKSLILPTDVTKATISTAYISL